MNDTVAKTISYLFIMGVLLILVAYWAGSKQLLQTLFSGVNTLDLTATGRNSAGQFAAYPKQ